MMYIPQNLEICGHQLYSAQARRCSGPPEQNRNFCSNKQQLSDRASNEKIKQICISIIPSQIRLSFQFKHTNRINGCQSQFFSITKQYMDTIHCIQVRIDLITKYSGSSISLGIFNFSLPSCV